jgi:ATP-dependent RNA helicase DDX21
MIIIFLARGIEYLFPVQYRSFNEIMSGKDCIVQARKIFPFLENIFFHHLLIEGTGTGKTLAFSLPIVERLQREISNSWGRSPRCLVLEPTRELAKQVTNDFLSIKSRLLSISTLYGGKEYSRQELSLKRGSDIVVGTPGRIKDFLNQKKLNLHQCQIIVLDEVDRMLDMGFQVRMQRFFNPLFFLSSRMMSILL